MPPLTSTMRWLLIYLDKSELIRTFMLISCSYLDKANKNFEELAKLALADPTSEANLRKMTAEGMMEILKDAYEEKFTTTVG